VTSPLTALTSFSGSGFTPLGGHGLKAGESTTADALVDAKSISSNRSFAQMLRDANSHYPDGASDSGVADAASRTAGGAASAIAKGNATVAGAPAKPRGAADQLTGSANQPVRSDSAEPGDLPATLLAVSPVRTALSLREARPALAKEGPSEKEQAGQGQPAAKRAASSDSFEARQSSIPLIASEAALSTAVNRTKGSLSIPARAAKVVPTASALAPKTMSLKAVTALAGGNANRVETVNSAAAANPGVAASIRPVQASTSWEIAALPNGEASQKSNASGVTSDGSALPGGNRLLNKTEMVQSAVQAQAAVPAGNLAFALRLKSTESNDAIRDSAESGGEPSGDSQSGSRLLDVLLTGPKGVSRSTASDTSNRDADGGWVSRPSAQSFNSQLKALTSGLSGQQSSTPASQPAPSSGTSSESESSDGRGPANLDFNLGLANAGLLKTGIGGSIPAPAVATRVFSFDGLVDSSQFSGVQAQTPTRPAAPSTNAGAAATGAAGSLPDKDVALSSAPVRDVRVQLSGEGNQRVDMHLIERGGTLSVSVRSSDETLTRSLQDNLPDLNTRLSARHFQTETWMPTRGASTSSSDADSGSGGGSNSGAGSHESAGNKQGQSSPDEGSGSRNRSGQPPYRRQDGRPAWVRHLAALDGIPQ
jgi:hypothetical protein